MNDSNLSSPRVTSRHIIHTGRKFNYEQVEVLMPSGKRVARQLVKHPGAVVIIPILPDGRVVLVNVYRHSVDRPLLECCAGTLEAGEDPAACAGREMIEETGYEAAPGDIAALGTFYTSPGLSDELMRAFVATRVRSVGQHLEEDESIEVVVLTPADLWKAVDAGQVQDGKSLTALFLAQRRGFIRAG